MALSEIEKLERRYAENPQGLTFAPLAEAYRKSGDPARALEVLRPGLALHPDYIPASIVLGRCAIDTGDDATAEGAFTHVLSLDSENVIALKALADVTERGGRYPEALRWLDLLLAVDRSNEEARLQRERVRQAMRAAEASVTTAVVAAPTMVEAPVAAAAPEVAAEMAEAPPNALAAALQAERVVAETPPVEERRAAEVSPAVDERPADEPWRAIPVGAVPSTADTEPEAMPLPEPVSEPGDAAVMVPPVALVLGPLTAEAEVVPPAVEPWPLPRPEAAPPEQPEAAVIPMGHVADADEAALAAPAAFASLDVGAEVEKAEEIVLAPVPTSEFQLPDASAELRAAEAAPAVEVPDEPEPIAAAEALPPDEPAAEIAEAIVEAAVAAAEHEVPAVSGEPLSLDEVPQLQVTSVMPVPEPEGLDPFTTETMAEVFAAQGHYAQALDVYRRLLERDPTDRRLAGRAAELSVLAAPPPLDEVPSVPVRRAVLARQTGGRPLREQFAALVQVQAVAPLRPVVPPPEAAVVTAEAAASPTRPAEQPVSLRHAFGDEAAPVPPVRTGASVSYDEFFAPADRPGTTGGQGEDDLAQFRAWLDQLKR